MKDIVNKIIGLIGDNFPNGIRDDFIDTNKILRIYLTNGGESVSRGFISEIIRSTGIEEDGRFYLVSLEGAAQVRKLFDDLLEKNSILYYSSVCKKNSEFFAHRHISSTKVLKKILRASGRHFYFKDFCAAHKAVCLEREIEKIFTVSKKLLTFGDLQEKLPYVPKEKISAVLADSKKFFRTAGDKYISVAVLRFDFEEIQAASRRISFLIETKGFATSEDYVLSSNIALNPAVPEKDLCKLIYEKFLSAKFDRSGKKLIKKGAAVAKKTRGSVNNVQKFIAAQDEFSIGNIFMLRSLPITQTTARFIPS